MVSKLLVSRATLPFHRITRSHTSSSSNFFSSSLSLLPRAQLFNARHHGEEVGKRKETLLENDKFQAISKQEGRGIVATPHCHLNRQKPRFRTRPLIYFAIGKTYGSRADHRPTNRFTLLPSIDLPS